MLATATHDHKRGEDVRARLSVLASVPDLWRQEVTGWDWLAETISGGEAGAIHPADRYALWQTIIGAWPAGLTAADGAGRAAFAERLTAWQQKALREAKLRSSWEAPDEAYEAACAAFVTAMFGEDRFDPLMNAVEAFAARLQPAFEAAARAQVALKLTVPGMPDTYQGTEREDFSLVDPDNRRPVDYAVRQGSGHWKSDLLRDLLALRRDHASLFAGGSYQPIEASGPRAANVVAFRREKDGAAITCAVAIRLGAAIVEGGAALPDAEWWGETRFGDTLAADAFTNSPVYLQA